MIGEICASPHIQKMIDLKKHRSCKIYVEIGVLYGGSLIKQMEDNQECRFIGIDPFSGYYGNTYDPHRRVDLTDHLEIVNKNITENNPHNHIFDLIKGFSNECMKPLKDLLKQDKIDYLFIDGDHSYQGVMDDFNNYKQFMNQDGLMVFDNYNDPNWQEVKVAVDEIIENHRDVELIDKFGHCAVIKIQGI